MQVVDALLETGVAPDAVNNEGCTALFCAAQHGHSEVLRQLCSGFYCQIQCMFAVVLDPGVQKILAPLLGWMTPSASRLLFTSLPFSLFCFT